MSRLENILTKPIDVDEQELKDILKGNIKKYRHRRNWSQFTLAAKIDISTNFLADIEAGNTWVSAQTLIKLAKAFDIEAYELLKPEQEDTNLDETTQANETNELFNRFLQDLTVVLQENVEKSVEHIKKQYKIGL
jgi:transcriptional regulator with XRE-family HTH domain